MSTIYKFTTMGAEEHVFAFGHFLRRTSLDELPQLVNILRGEMSFIGPRPLLEAYLINYTTNQIKRHNVLPGITGLAQINGRQMISLDDKLEFDLQYVKRIGIWMDLTILGKTILQLFKWKEADLPENTFKWSKR
jgi:lipopolysaccharide/colanic/teichoic acid biosynthesis glycosyltransferase